MLRMRTARLGGLLLALQLLSWQLVQAQNATEVPVNATEAPMNATVAPVSVTTLSYNVTPTAQVNVTARENNGCRRTGAPALLLLPLALTACLHGASR